jgi:imidazolonepropionase-like amidohydrolase
MSESILFTNCRLFTGVNEEAISDGSVWVEGNIIRYAGRTSELGSLPDGVRRVDLRGQFVMPGMTESHAHISYTNNGPGDLDKTPVEQAMIWSVDNARLMLGSGFTSAISFGSVHRIDVSLRDAIEKGYIVGPRICASGRDIGATSSNADLHPDYAKPQMEGLGMLADGPWAIRKAVRTLRKNGANVVKLFLDGEGLSNHAPPGELTYTDEECAAAIDEAHRRGMRVATHSRSAESVKQAVKFGADFIGHANYLDAEAVDMLRQARQRLFVGPAIAWEIAFLANHESMGFPRDSVKVKAYEREVEATKDAVRRLRHAGVRVLIGGDYGLNVTPHGTYAKDLEYFVDLFGLSPAEALLCATRDGGAATDPNGMLGTLEEGKFADLVIVDGNPLLDIRVLQDHSRITAVMKDGTLYRGLTSRKNPYEASADDLDAGRGAKTPQQREEQRHAERKAEQVMAGG